MPTVLEGVPQGSRVAVIRLRSLGDCVLTTPALELLHQFRSDLRIGVVVEERFGAVFEGHPAVEALLAPCVETLRRWRPELCLNLHGGTRSAWLTAFSSARLRAGFGHFRCQWIYNVRIPRAQEILGEQRKVHTAEHLASAIFHLGAPRTEIPRARLFAEPPAGARPYAVLHPFASDGSKTWPAERFLAVAKHLAEHLEREPVFVAGASDNAGAFRRWRVVAGAPLAEVKSLIRGASVFVGNDSGPAHMAAAFGVPAVVLFGASDPEIWGPWRSVSAVVRGASGIDSITGREVLSALERLRVAA